MKILQGDCLEILPTIGSNWIDSVVTDPPYGLKFMGKDWDHSVPGEHFWREILRVAKPGAHLLAFGGTRTYHRLVCAIEDAGWEIRDTIAWVYGSGFPKSLNIGGGFGTALKPAFEPIVLARKHLAGTVAANVQEYGTGAMNIDGCRVGTEPSTTYPKRRNAKIFTTGSGGQDVPAPHNGRWPANFVHDGSEEVVALFPETISGAISPNHKNKGIEHIGTFKIRDRSGEYDIPSSSGSAARFFYTAKASSSERNSHAQNRHPTVKPISLMTWLCRLITPPGGVILDPFMGSGSTGVAAKMEGFHFFGIELDPHWCDVAKRRIKMTAHQKNLFAQDENYNRREM